MSGVCPEWQSLLSRIFWCVLDKLIELENIYAQLDMEKLTTSPERTPFLTYAMFLYYSSLCQTEKKKNKTHVIAEV